MGNCMFPWSLTNLPDVSMCFLVPQEDELKKGELEADTDRMMKEYRAQLDAERARKLAHGRNRSSSKTGHEKGTFDEFWY